ncbi:MAG: hypothetical protein HQL28_04745, partial [Candidatus Omnitrophica bacterium]|nr:hypothetical protein [Candidatus Omnitrophota bacterium]
ENFREYSVNYDEENSKGADKLGIIAERANANFEAKNKTAKKEEEIASPPAEK